MTAPTDSPDGRSPRLPHLPPGTVLGDFRVIDFLAAGSMGAVYVAEQMSLSRTVAIKVFSRSLTDDEEALDRFLRETKLTASLDHPNIVTAITAGQKEDLIYLAMKYIDGRDLADLLNEYPRIDEQDTLAIIQPIAEALGYAWQRRQLIHRDIKPSNIKLGQDTTPYLLDLGIALAGEQDTSLTMAGFVIGTPDYMSPEQSQGNRVVDLRTDIYSLGATMYHMVTGSVPFTADSPTGVLVAQISAPLEPPMARNPKVSKAMNDLIVWMMAKNPDDRPATWEAVTDAITEIRATPPVANSTRTIRRPSGTLRARGSRSLPAPTAAATSRGRLTLWLIAVAVLATAAFGTVMARKLAGASLAQQKEEAPPHVQEEPPAQLPPPAAAAAEVDRITPLMTAPRTSLTTAVKIRGELQQILASPTGTAEADRCREALATLETEINQANQVLNQLRNNAFEVLGRAGLDAAEATIMAYRGPAEDWLKAQTPQILADLRAENRKRQISRREAEAQSLRKVQKIANAIIGRRMPEARQLAEELPADAQGRDEIVRFLAICEAIVEPFRSKVGTIIEIPVRDGPQRFTLEKVAGGELFLVKKDPALGTIKRTVSAWDLAPESSRALLKNLENDSDTATVLDLFDAKTRTAALLKLKNSNSTFLHLLATEAAGKLQGD